MTDETATPDNASRLLGHLKGESLAVRRVSLAAPVFDEHLLAEALACIAQLHATFLPDIGSVARRP